MTVAKIELLTTIMSSLAQEESRIIPENVTWGRRKRFSDGKVGIPYGQFRGYRKGADGLPEILPEEAEIVKRIYREFIQGKSTNAIATVLAEPVETVFAGLRAQCQTLCQEIFYLEGGYGSTRLREPFRLIMHMMCDSLTKKEVRTPEELAMLEALMQGGDFVREENLDGILQFLCRKNQLQKNSN